MPTPTIRFSVVVPVHNNPEDLRRCLSSLRALAFDPARYEIIVVDNNSTDETGAVAAGFGVTCLAERAFQSSYAARNRGIAAARGEFVAFTDSDCVADPGWLAAIDAATGEAGVGCFAGEILSVEPTTPVERFSDAIGLLRQRGPLSGWHFKPYAQTANAVYRKAVFDRIGVFDPAMTSGGDAAIAWRMLDGTDFRLRFVPEAIVRHHHRTDAAGLWSQFRRYGGGKMAWALDQPDYAPPDVARLESDIVGRVQAHLDALAKAGASEAETVFPLLRTVTEMAHLSGYLQDLVRIGFDGAPIAAAPERARARRPGCDLCGSRAFVPGPNGRLAHGRPPRCRDCGSLEAHRTLHRLFATLDRAEARGLSCLAVGEPLREELRIFGEHRHVGVDDLLAGRREAPCDLVIAAAEAMTGFAADPPSHLERLVAPLRQSGSLWILSAPADAAAQHGGGRTGEDLASYLPNARGRRTRLLDGATGAGIDMLVFGGPSAPLIPAGAFAAA